MFYFVPGLFIQFYYHIKLVLVLNVLVFTIFIGICFFIHHNRLTPMLPARLSKVQEVWIPIQYFVPYIDGKIFRDLAAFTNEKQLQTARVLLNTAAQQIKIFFGISVHMACLSYPRVKMFGLNKLTSFAGKWQGIGSSWEAYSRLLMTWM